MEGGGVAQCKAKSKRSGVRCLKPSTPGRKHCHIHGGKSLVGVDAPNFQHGRYSKHIPDQLSQRYHAALKDKDLICMNDEIALIDTRLGQMLDRLGGLTMIADGWAKARGLYRSFRSHANAKREKRALKALDQLGDLLEGHEPDDTVWLSIRELIDDRRKLVDTERKRLLDEDQVVSVERLMVLVAAIVDIIKRNVASREERAAVSNEVRRLVAGGSGDS